MKIFQRLGTSSKWQVGAVGISWALAMPWLTKIGVSEEQFQNVLLMLFGVLGAQAVTDLGKEAKTQ